MVSFIDFCFYIVGTIGIVIGSIILAAVVICVLIACTILTVIVSEKFIGFINRQIWGRKR